jgi:uncharacterized membrane protein
MTIAITLHLLATVIWVGGMFFAHMALRPSAAEVLEAPLRLTLMSTTLGRFFHWVWAVVVVIPLTGYWLIFSVFGGMANVGLHVHIMSTLGWLMVALFVFLYLGPYRRMRAAVETGDFPGAAARLALIRKIITVNLSLGLVEVVLGTGRYWLH